MLEIVDLSASYNGIQALRGISFRVNKGDMVALIGPNGAGKSTLLNCISGIVPVASGSIRFEGQDIVNRSPWSISRGGLLQVPEGRQVLAEMSVLENLQIGANALSNRPASYSLDRVFALFPVLAERRDQFAGSLSGGQQQMLAVGRALMGAPRLLLLDEPSLGLAPVVTKQLFQTFKALNADALSIVLVEQNARLALEVTNRAYVIEQGRIVHEGESAALAANPDIAAMYFGQAHPGKH